MRNRRLLAFSPVLFRGRILPRSEPKWDGTPSSGGFVQGLPWVSQPAAMFVVGTVAQRCMSTRVARTRPRQLLPRPAPIAPVRLQAATFCPLIESRRFGNAFPIRGPKLGCSLAEAGKRAPLCNRWELIAPDDLNNAVTKAKLGLEPASQTLPGFVAR